MTYATSEEVRLAESLGYGWNCNQQRGHVFQRGQRHIWACAADRPRVGDHDGPLAAWMTADLGPGGFTNHQKFVDLADALRRP